MALRDLLAPFEARRLLLFVLSGILLSVFAANSGLAAYVGTSYPAVQTFVGPAGFLFGALGVLGLYPALIDRSPGLAKVGATVAAVAALGWFVITTLGLVELAGLAELPSVGPIAIVVFISIPLSYSIAGISILRYDAHPTLVGVFVLLPAVMFILLMARIGTEFLIDLGHTVGHLGAAVTLWSQGATTEHTDAAPDATA